MSTLNQIVQTIKGFGEIHSQLKTSSYGEAIDVISKGDVKYPAMFFSINSASILLRQIEYSFSIYILDRQLVDAEDELEVHSDTTLIAQDIVALLRDNENTFTIGESVQMTYVVETNPDYLAGVLINVTISTSSLNDRCRIPYNN